MTYHHPGDFEMHKNIVVINGRQTTVNHIQDDRGTAMIWVNGICQTWRCKRENGRWLPTFQSS